MSKAESQKLLLSAATNNRAVLRRQSGLSLINLILAILVGGLFITCVLKMVPVYIENWNIQSILKDLQTQLQGEKIVEKRQIRLKILKRMNIDMIKSVTDKDIQIKKDKDIYRVTANYETRVPLVGNIDVVMKFNNNTVDIPIHNN